MNQESIAKSKSFGNQTVNRTIKQEISQTMDQSITIETDRHNVDGRTGEPEWTPQILIFKQN